MPLSLMKSLLFLAVLLSTTTTARSNAPQVKLGNTTLIGRDITGLKQDFFGGIPYAEPPLGNLRLKPPVLKKHLDSVIFDASNFGLACLQPDVPTSSVSEDCLTINIFRPSKVRPKTKLPVLFWTYGGGFQAGSSSMFNGSLIVNRSVERGTPLIYVNFNYRLGPLGFPQGQEAYDKKALNLAIQDEIIALEWVQHNIRAFGGDKNKVTVFGESAGAIMSSILYLNSPLDRLARGVILESGSQASSINFPAIRRQSTWQLFVEGVPSCTSTASSNDTFDCLRQANSSGIFAGLLSGIQNSPDAFPFEPAIDGPGGVYPDLPSRIFDNGTFARVPFIAGTSIDEGE
ncbi:CAZyme family CE10 [Agaricus bisporus var. burnettii]|uniref:Carboxylic ester hydrolase n=1 Tax=Agaricus bisporus var. burnettii TaxID=192524 RepID=A0A8H7KGR9_AGABI|nr:CAZyme family CE10 [Agaricus bisporus var. burnettii]